MRKLFTSIATPVIRWSSIRAVSFAGRTRSTACQGANRF